MFLAPGKDSLVGATVPAVGRAGLHERAQRRRVVPALPLELPRPAARVHRLNVPLPRLICPAAAAAPRCLGHHQAHLRVQASRVEHTMLKSMQAVELRMRGAHQEGEGDLVDGQQPIQHLFQLGMAPAYSA